jgi:hypothetical protein
MCHCSLSPMFFSGYIFPLTTCRWDLFRSVKPSCVEVTWKVSPKNRNKNHDFTFNVQYIGIIYSIKSNKNQMNFRFRFMAFNATFKNISVISWQSIFAIVLSVLQFISLVYTSLSSRWIHRGSYDNWIYNYLCNQCLSPLKLWVWNQFMARCTRFT